MKRYLLFVPCLLLSAVLCHSQDVDVGGHIVYPMGGDVESGSLGLGVQAEMGLTDMLGIEFSAARFSDDWIEEGMTFEGDATTVALTLLVRRELREGLTLYGGVGLNYTMFDIDGPSILEAMAADEGMTVADAQAWLDANGATLTGGIDVDVDDSIGYLLCIGAELVVADNIQVFGDFRFSSAEVEGSMSANYQLNVGGIAVSEGNMTEPLDGEDYNFGLLRLGVKVAL